MTLVVLTADASAAARSIVHSHQDSFGHQLEVLGTHPAAPGRLDVTCRCGWHGSLPARDLDVTALPAVWASLAATA